MQHLMIDLATLGTAFNAPVLAIGAVYFDPDTGDLGDRFYGGIDMADACRYGRPNGDTIRWWLGQSEDARKAVVAGKHPAKHVFEKFQAYCLKGGQNIKPWGNGARFDIAILDYSFPRILDAPPPWKFWNVRDCRTIKDLASKAPAFTETLEGTAHQALDAAVHQAKWVSHYWRYLRGTKDVTAVSNSEVDLLA